LAIIELVDNPAEILAIENAKKRAKAAGSKKKSPEKRRGRGKAAESESAPDETPSESGTAEE
jgi:hypothetical protein